jgi:HlyD family secretion protein
MVVDWLKTPQIAAICMIVAALTGCSKLEDRGYQGWVEADLIFVSPDENGRLETLSVREGQTVEIGRPLFSLDTELYIAEVEVAKAALANADKDYERAKRLYQTGTGPLTTVEDMEAAYRTASARLNQAQTRLLRRKMASPVNGSVQRVYFRAGEQVEAIRPVVSLLPPENIKTRFFVPETTLARPSCMSLAATPTS